MVLWFTQFRLLQKRFSEEFKHETYSKSVHPNIKLLRVDEWEEDILIGTKVLLKNASDRQVRLSS
jgi:hypothetical protein